MPSFTLHRPSNNLVKKIKDIFIGAEVEIISTYTSGINIEVTFPDSKRNQVRDALLEWENACVTLRNVLFPAPLPPPIAAKEPVPGIYTPHTTTSDD